MRVASLPYDSLRRIYYLWKLDDDVQGTYCGIQTYKRLKKKKREKKEEGIFFL